MSDEQKKRDLTYTEALAEVARLRLRGGSVNTSMYSPPHPELADVVPLATQVKLTVANWIMASIGTIPGDLPVDQTITYHAIHPKTLNEVEQKWNMPIRRQVAPLVGDYIGLLHGGKRLPYPEVGQRFYDGLIDCFLTEAEMVLTAQYFYGLKLDDPGISQAMFAGFKRGDWTVAVLSDHGAVVDEIKRNDPGELDEFILSGLNQFSFTELHARLFVDHYATMIRAQWDKLTELASVALKQTKSWDHIKDGLDALVRKVENPAEPLSPFSRQHFRIFFQIASERLKSDSWLKQYRDSLLHKIGPRSSGLLPHRKTLYSTTDSWARAKEEHNWLREAMVAMLIAVIAATAPQSSGE